jgi:hypothetical protein
VAVLLNGGYGPFNGTPYFSDSWRSFYGHVAVPGVLRGVDESLRTFGDSSGMQVKVRPGQLVAQSVWGRVATETIVTIPTAHATLARRDRVVWRITYDVGVAGAGTGGKIELDVLQGTTTGGVTDPLLVSPPDITRNSAIFEGSLAVVNVAPAASGIASTNVFDARTYGGTISPTVVDDYILAGDAVSTCSRREVTGTPAAIARNVMTAQLTTAVRDCQVTKARVASTNGLTGTDTLQIGVYLGYTPFELSLFRTVTFSTMPANVVQQGTMSSLDIKAGQLVGLALLHTTGTGGSDANPILGVTQGVISAGPAGADLLNQGTTPPPSGDGFWSSIFKSGVSSLPSRLNGHDGSWTKNSRVNWVALA